MNTTIESIKNFYKNGLSIEICVKGTPELPLVRASDVGAVLDITNIRTSIKDFDETEKVVQTVNTLGGPQEVTFLTEKGLYQVLFTSRKPIAKQFKNWVCDILREIRINGTYTLQKKIEEVEQKLVENKEVNETEKQELLEKIYIDQFPKNTPCIYFGLIDNLSTVGEKLGKGGYTYDLERRLKEHKKTYKNFKLVSVFKVLLPFSIDMSLCILFRFTSYFYLNII